MGGNKSPPLVKGMIKLAKKRKPKKQSKYTLYRNRVLATMRRLKKKGYAFDELYFPTEREIRKSGVKGQELRYLTLRLKKLTSKELVKMARIVYEDAGDRFNGDEDMYDESALLNFQAQIMKYPHGFVGYMIAWINRLIRTKGKRAVVEMLDKGFKSGLEVTSAVMYKLPYLNEFVDKMMSFLPDVGEIEKSDILDLVEEDAYAETLEQEKRRYRDVKSKSL